MSDRASPNLPSRDLNATRTFHEGFGFREQYRDERWMILPRGTLQLEFFAHPGLEPSASNFQLALIETAPA